MNPFDLRGPEFLFFYTLFGAATLALLSYFRRTREAGSSSQPLLTDYLQIAYLRGGHKEALHVATMSLINRDLLEVVDGDQVRTPDSTAVPAAAKRTERALIERFRTAGAATSIFTDAELVAAAKADCEPDLIRLGLLPGDEARAARDRLRAAAFFALVGVAAIKIVVALSRGRSNLLFLILETVVFSVLAHKMAHPFRTPSGDALLAELKTLFEGLRARAGSLALDSDTQEVAHFMAVFGTDALPPAFASETPFRRAKGEGASSSGAACGSVSCGASAGSSCGGSSGSSCGGGGGSSCGGGGGGGGCGGCGS